MPDANEQQKIFVVLESGAEWPSKLDFGGLTDVHIVVQQRQEPKRDFTRRVSTRLARASRSGGGVGASAFLVNPGLHYADVEARCAITRALASALAWKRGALLTLTGNRLSPECHAHLVAMALVIEDELADAVRIRVVGESRRPAHPEGAAPRSGIFERVGADPVALLGRAAN
jgi:hypothetical protein